MKERGVSVWATGIWLLLGLGVLAYSGSELSILFEQAPPALSDQARRIRMKWDQLEQSGFLSVADTADQLDLGRLLARFEPAPAAPPAEPPPSPLPVREEPGEQPPVQVPLLTGLLRISDGRGNIHSLAVLNGQPLKQGETVNGFSVQEIGPEGVVLVKDNARWFVPAPETEFSSIRTGMVRDRQGPPAAP